MLITDWLDTHERAQARSHLKLGLTCVGLHYIWRLRNNLRHDDQTSFNSQELSKWAGYLVNVIPKRNMDRADFRRVQMALGIPYNIRSTIKGRWAVWTPNKQGLTMDVAISEECEKTAIIIRDSLGNFVEADKRKTEPIQSAEDLECIIDSWRNLTRWKIASIKYSHHFKYSSVSQPRGESVEKVHPLILRASLSLCYTNLLHNRVNRTEELPLPTQRIISQDKDKLRIFCNAEEGSEERSSNGVQSNAHSDDNPNRSYRFRRNLFYDDTNT